MRPDVEHYFKEKFGGFAGFIQAGTRRGIDPENMVKACEITYESISGNESVVSIGQKVHLNARLLQKQKVHSREKRIDSIESSLNSLLKRIDEIKDLREARIDIETREKQLGEYVSHVDKGRTELETLILNLINDVKILQERMILVEKSKFAAKFWAA